MRAEGSGRNVSRFPFSAFFQSLIKKKKKKTLNPTPQHPQLGMTFSLSSVVDIKSTWLCTPSAVSKVTLNEL